MSHRSLVSLTLACLCACGDSSGDSTAAGSSGGGDSSGDATTATTGGDPQDAYACVDPDFTVNMPLAGPGYDPDSGLVDPQATYVLSTTQALPRPEKLAEFGQLVGAAGMAAAQAPGLVAISFASEPNCGFQRTLTIWRDEAAMMAFVVGPEHAAAMSRASEVLLTGRTTHLTIDAAQVETGWEAALTAVADAPGF